MAYQDIISKIVDIQIIPVILLPVTGLITLVFYNRAASMNQRIRGIQKELRDLLVGAGAGGYPKRMKEMVETLKEESRVLDRRKNLIAVSIFCCLLSVFLFSLCAFFVSLTLFVPSSPKLALAFWFLGPICICIGIVAAIAELIYSLRTLKMQSYLVEEWDGTQDDSTL